MIFNPKLHHRRSVRLKNYDYSKPGYYFVTICTHGKRCVLGEFSNGEIRLNDLGMKVEAIWRELPDKYPGVGIDEYVVMPNHLHGIIILNVGAGPRARPMGHPQGGAPTVSLPEVIHRFKSLTSYRYMRVKTENNSLLWQRNYYEHVIRSEESLAEIRRYVLENPIKWQFDEENPDVK